MWECCSDICHMACIQRIFTASKTIKSALLAFVCKKKMWQWLFLKQFNATCDPYAASYYWHNSLPVCLPSNIFHKKKWILNCITFSLAGAVPFNHIIKIQNVRASVYLTWQLCLVHLYPWQSCCFCSPCSEHCLYACYGLNLHRGSKPKHVRDVGKYLPQPGTEGFCLNCLFQTVSNPLLVAFELSNLYNSKAYRANLGKPNTSGQFLWLICHCQEAKGCKLDNSTACASEYWQLFGLVFI